MSIIWAISSAPSIITFYHWFHLSRYPEPRRLCHGGACRRPHPVASSETRDHSRHSNRFMPSAAAILGTSSHKMATGQSKQLWHTLSLIRCTFRDQPPKNTAQVRSMNFLEKNHGHLTCELAALQRPAQAGPLCVQPLLHRGWTWPAAVCTTAAPAVWEPPATHWWLDLTFEIYGAHLGSLAHGSYAPPLDAECWLTQVQMGCPGWLPENSEVPGGDRMISKYTKKSYI